MDIMVFVNICISVWKQLIKSSEWEAIFTNSALASRKEAKEEKSSIIAEILTDEEAYILAEKLKKISGFNLIKQVNEIIKIKSIEHGFSDIDIDKCISIFDNNLKTEIEINDNKMYKAIYLEEFRQENKAAHNLINEKLDKLSKQKDDEWSADIHSIDYVEQYLKRNYKYNIDLEFFDYGETKIDEEIKNKILEDKNVYIKIRSREEGILYVLRVIKNMLPEYIKRVFVVNDVEAWNTVEKENRHGIFIPNFEREEIPALTTGQVIFIYSANDYIRQSNIIEVPNRTQNNLYNVLIKFIKDTETTNDIVGKTLGLFGALKRELFIGKMKKPSWYNEKNNDLIPALLVGSWINRDGDKQIISQLAGIEYDDYIESIRLSMEQSEPFAIKFHSFYGIEFRIPDLHTAWSILGTDIIYKYFGKLTNIIKYIVIDYVKEYKQQYSYTKGIFPYSDQLRKGIVRTLVFMSLYGKSNDSSTLQKFVNNTVNNIMNSVSTENEWLGIAEFLPDLFEASPDIILERLNYESKQQDSTLYKLFVKKETGIFALGQHYKIINVLEKALFVKGYAKMAILILENLSEHSSQYALANSASDVLSKVFCGWYQEVNLSMQIKIELLDSWIAKNPNACWKVLKEILPLHGLSVTYSPLSKPEYLPRDVLTAQIPRDTLISTYKCYFKRAFKCAQKDLKKWGEFFRNCNFIDYGFEEEVISDIQRILCDNEATDEEKYNFSMIVRRYIVNNRLYVRNSRRTEEELEKLTENVLNKIVYKNPAYKYLCYFNGEHNTYNLYPKLNLEYHDADKQWNDISNIQKGILKQYISNTLFDFNFMLEKCSDDWMFGANIAEIISSDQFEENIVDALYASRKNYMLSAYASRLCTVHGTKYICENISKFANKQWEPKLIYNILSVVPFSIDFAKFLETEPIDVQKLYWESFSKISASSEEVRLYIVKKLMEYKNYVASLKWIAQYKYPIDYYLNILTDIATSNSNLFSGTMEFYYIEKVFAKIYDIAKGKDEYKQKIIYLEEFYFNCYHEMKVKYVLKELQTNPKYCAKLVKMLYKSENDEKNKQNTQEEQNLAKLAFDIFYYVKFCPWTDDDGNVDGERFATWCNEFSRITENNGQKVIGQIVLAQILANSPSDKDGVWPNKKVCEEIEKHSNDKDFYNNFITAVLNNRGNHMVGAGEEEKNIALKYESYSEARESSFPYISKILMAIADEYRNEARQLRDRASYGE